MKKLFLILAACGTDPVLPPPSVTTPTINAVIPAQAFIGRDLRIEVSGDATNWTDGISVDFGPGVVVHSVAVASPTSLFADVTIADAATAGLTDVSVGTLVLHAGLDLEPPLHVTTTGTLAQGSIVDVVISNEDFANPFDLSTVLFGGEFPNIDIQLPPGAAVQSIVSGSEYKLEAVLTIDVDAQPGELVIESGPKGHGLRMSAGTFAIAPRAPIAIAPNTVLSGGTTGPYESSLYVVALDTAPSVALAAADSGGFVVLPASGKFADSPTLSPTSTFDELDLVPNPTLYLVYGGSPFATDPYNLQVFQAALTQVNETAAANDTGATAQAITLPALFANAKLTSINDVDVVKVAVGPADAGKTVHVITEGDASTLIDVFLDAAGTRSIGESNGGASEDFASNPIPAGTTAIYVKFSSLSDFDPDLTAYLAAIFLQ